MTPQNDYYVQHSFHSRGVARGELRDGALHTYREHSEEIERLLMALLDAGVPPHTISIITHPPRDRRYSDSVFELFTHIKVDQILKDPQA